MSTPRSVKFWLGEPVVTVTVLRYMMSAWLAALPLVIELANCSVALSAAVASASGFA